MSEAQPRFSPLSFSLMLVAVLAITAGLSGFLDFNIATYGVYFVSSLGILLMVYRIELQHSLSELIDSKFGSVPGMESEYNSTRSIINTTLVLSFAILLLTSFYALSRQFTLLFAVCLAASAGLFGLFLGRTYNGISSGGSDSWSSQHSDQKYAEFNELRQWLEGGQSSTLSVHVMSKIEKQRSVFVREIESVISDKSSLTSLLINLSESEIMHEALLRGPLRRVQAKWLVDALEYIKKEQITQFRQLLGSLLSLPVKMKLLEALSTPGVGHLPHEEKARLFGRLLQGAEEDAVRLQGFGFSHTNADERNQVSFNIQDDTSQFVLFVSKKANTTPLYDFSPGWLHRLMCVFQLQTDQLERSIDARPQHYDFEIRSAVEDFGSWCLCISELLQGRELVDHQGIPEDFSDLFDKIREKNTGQFERDIVLMTWFAYVKLA
ncbi:hypothetical protein N9M68_06645 [Candidatus Poseidonia alphae]|nr:hypothetical protein [Candidatus Poseidonia alphae]MDA8749791.1 hypothetical protein [Candidatus Poseidonia alphae]